MKDKISISLSKVVKEYEKARKDCNFVLANELSKLFINATEDTIELEKDSKIVSLFDKEEINLESLAFSYIKSMYKKNNDQKNKLKKYLFDYMSNIENEIDNSYIVEMIKDDKKLFEYIKKTNDAKSLEKSLTKKEKKKNNKVQEKQKENQLIKGKPYIN